MFLFCYFYKKKRRNTSDISDIKDTILNLRDDDE